MYGLTVLWGIILLILTPTPALAMHISEGILPFKHALFWTVIGFGFVAFALRSMNRHIDDDPRMKPFLGMIGAGVFLLSAMPIPVPFAGTVSHPAATGIAAILVGPAATVVITSITLLLHALFLAHGGLSTLGADIFCMGVLGGFSGYYIYHFGRGAGFGQTVSAFLAGLLGDWATYIGTSGILALALSGPDTGASSLFLTVLLAFIPTQLPLGILEGIIAVSVVGFLLKRRPDMTKALTRIVPVLLVCLVMLSMVAPSVQASETGAAWPGVDAVIVEETAREHGQKPAEPLIPIEGDLLLFAFLSGGAIGGFFLGYYYHKLFIVGDGHSPDSPETD